MAVTCPSYVIISNFLTSFACWVLKKPEHVLASYLDFISFLQTFANLFWLFIFLLPQYPVTFMLVGKFFAKLLHFGWMNFPTDEFRETCHSVTFIGLVNSHQRWKQTRFRSGNKLEGKFHGVQYLYLWMKSFIHKNIITQKVMTYYEARVKPNAK